MEPYYAGLQRVLTYIDNHLTEDLSLSVLAQVSGYSPYHFHRLFHALTGQTLHDYVLTRKINTAASQLLYDRCSITQIALDCGFSSPGSFVRCFQKNMHCSPSFYRKYKERKRPLAPADGIAKAYAPNDALDAMFSVTTLPDIRAAGIVTKGLSEQFQSKEIEKAFAKLFAWVAKAGLNAGRMDVLGITLDTPEVVPLSECRYFACVSVDEDIRPGDGITIRTLPLKGRYIRFSLERTRPDFPEAFFQLTDYLYGSYMPRTGRYPDNRSFVEIYRQSGSGVGIMYYVPVQ